MAYFGKYIRQILSRKETVIFPGFGSLILEEVKGLKTEEGKISPPGTVIKFDPTHPKDDMKLSSEYAQGEGIDIEEAGQQLLELVDAIKFKLDKGEVYNLASVGKFTRDDDNRIHFQKDINWVIDPELFGLDSLDLLELEKESVSSDEKVELKKEATEHTVKKEKAAKKPAERKEKRPVTKWTVIWVVIGSLIAVLVVILLIPAGEEGNAIEFGTEGLVIRDADKDRSPGVIEKGQEKRTEQRKQVTDQKIEKKVPDSSESDPAWNSYFIIAGSFQNLQNATELLNQLTEKGFPAEIIFTESRLYRVAIKSYPTKESALHDLTNLKAIPGLENIWIWQR